MSSRPFQFDFRSVEIEGDQREIVEGQWVARGRIPCEREQICPTGSAVAEFVLGDPIIEKSPREEPVRYKRGFLIPWVSKVVASSSLVMDRHYPFNRYRQSFLFSNEGSAAAPS